MKKQSRSSSRVVSPSRPSQAASEVEAEPYPLLDTVCQRTESVTPEEGTVKQHSETSDTGTAEKGGAEVAPQSIYLTQVPVVRVYGVIITKPVALAAHKLSLFPGSIWNLSLIDDYTFLKAKESLLYISRKKT